MLYIGIVSTIYFNNPIQKNKYMWLQSVVKSNLFSKLLKCQEKSKI